MDQESGQSIAGFLAQGLTGWNRGQPGLWSSPEAQRPFQSSRLVGRIQFLGQRPSSSRDYPPFPATWQFASSRPTEECLCCFESLCPLPSVASSPRWDSSDYWIELGLPGYFNLQSTDGWRMGRSYRLCTPESGNLGGYCRRFLQQTSLRLHDGNLPHHT